MTIPMLMPMRKGVNDGIPGLASKRVRLFIRFETVRTEMRPSGFQGMPRTPDGDALLVLEAEK